MRCRTIYGWDAVRAVNFGSRAPTYSILEVALWVS
jgi:hypothetical protein